MQVEGRRSGGLEGMVREGDPIEEVLWSDIGGVVGGWGFGAGDGRVGAVGAAGGCFVGHAQALNVYF